jgi:hypothetical protein
VDLAKLGLASFVLVRLPKLVLLIASIPGDSYPEAPGENPVAGS